MSESAGARDNFKLISGIGPATERRLHEAGIVSFSQLASLSTEDIAAHLQGMAGLSPERIQEWIQQANELATLNPLSETTSQEAAANGQHYATFTVELLLNETNEVRRTRVEHIQDRDRDTWTGWNAKRLLQFIEQQTGLVAVAVPEAEADLAAEEPASSRLLPLIGSVQMRELEIISSDAPSSRLISSGRPFNVRLVLELEGANDTPLNYEAKLYARRLGDGQRVMLGEAAGETTETQPLVIQLAARPERMRAGAYRLETDLTFSAKSGGRFLTTVPATLLAMH